MYLELLLLLLLLMALLRKHGKHTPLPPLFTLQQVFSGSDDAALLAACGMGPPEALPGAMQQGQQAEAPQNDSSAAAQRESSQTEGTTADTAGEETQIQQETPGDIPLPPSADEISSKTAASAEPSLTTEVGSLAVSRHRCDAREAHLTPYIHLTRCMRSRGGKVGLSVRALGNHKDAYSLQRQKNARRVWVVLKRRPARGLLHKQMGEYS